MAVSKRTRYEVLRRDNHTCRYCGGTAPDVALTVDHVVPQTLGGSDFPNNLVAACRDCNAGKAATNPDAPLVADVEQKAATWGFAMNRVLEGRRLELEAERKRLRKFDRRWKQWNLPDGSAIPRDVNWKNSLSRFYAAGLDDQFLADAVDTAFGKQHIPGKDKWKYFCGICWHEINDLLDRTTASVAEQDGTADEVIARSNPFDYMSMCDSLVTDLVCALGGPEDIQAFARRTLWDAMPEAHAEWLKVSDQLNADEATDIALEEFSSRTANSMYHLGLWHEMRTEFGRRYLGIVLSHAGLPESAIALAQRCYAPAIVHAIETYSERLKTTDESHQRAMDAVETDMHLFSLDAMLELGEQAEAIP